MKVQALYFGALRAKLGQAEAWLELPFGATAGDLALLACQDLGPDWLKALRLAVNEEFCTALTLLREGDRVALLPPVSGGR